MNKKFPIICLQFNERENVLISNEETRHEEINVRRKICSQAYEFFRKGLWHGSGQEGFKRRSTFFRLIESGGLWWRRIGMSNRAEGRDKQSYRNRKAWCSDWGRIRDGDFIWIGELGSRGKWSEFSRKSHLGQMLMVLNIRIRNLCSQPLEVFGDIWSGEWHN